MSWIAPVLEDFANSRFSDVSGLVWHPAVTSATMRMHARWTFIVPSLPKLLYYKQIRKCKLQAVELNC
jgi:hypothetical protein